MSNLNKKHERTTTFIIIYWVAESVLVLLAFGHLALWAIGLVDFNSWRFVGLLAAAIIMYLGWVIYFKIAIALNEWRLGKETRKQLRRPRPSGK